MYNCTINKLKMKYTKNIKQMEFMASTQLTLNKRRILILPIGTNFNQLKKYINKIMQASKALLSCYIRNS